MTTDHYSKGVIAGGLVVAGGLIGATLGILYAPKSGKEMRREIRHTADGLLEKTKTQFVEARNKIEKLVDREKEMAPGKKEKMKRVPETGVEGFK